ncbi:MAG: DUF4349 domain-containing protein [Labilithrix sp.]|nr:DUF4349 domain-containing protein [Labilithrix sp.]MCW5811416.1 DUF4349 domain-containing protein [Labilithrix sp.]
MLRRSALACLVFVGGCASSTSPATSAGTASLPAPSQARTPASEEESRGSGGICELDPSACPRDGISFASQPLVAEVYAQSTTVSSRRAGSASASASLPAAANARPHEMLDIDARFAIECESVTAAAAKLRESVREAGGTITFDQSETREQRSETTLEIRVPARDYERIAVELGGVGAIRTREVKVKDITKEHHDAQLLLSNLEAAMRRYEELLAKAAAVPEVLAIERELERLRARIDRVKGDLAWMQDRVARATVRVRLFTTSPADDLPLATRSALYPSLRVVMPFDLRGESERHGYLGGGLGLAWHPEAGVIRSVGADFGVARSAFTGRPPGSRYVYLALTSLDLYSDLLGGGRRRFFNPFLGLRAGYAQSGGRGDLALGGALGVDVWKGRNALVGLGVQGLALIGNDRGVHAMLIPELAFAFAF